jgi:TIR domain
MPRKVFISYRREDAKWQAREIYRALTRVLPHDNVFMDIDSIGPGEDFVVALERSLDQCDILLALIGPGWIDARDPKSGRSKLENPNDFVRLEINKALVRGIPVVPVLLDGASIPDKDKLPDDLEKLALRNAEFVEHRTADTDIERLIKKLRLAQSPPAKQPSPLPLAPKSDEELTDEALKARYSRPDNEYPIVDFGNSQAELRTLIDRYRFTNVEAARPLWDIDQLISAKAHSRSVLDRIFKRAETLINGSGTPVHNRADWTEIQQVLRAIMLFSGTAKVNRRR